MVNEHEKKREEKKIVCKKRKKKQQQHYLNRGFHKNMNRFYTRNDEKIIENNFDRLWFMGMTSINRKYSCGRENFTTLTHIPVISSSHILYNVIKVPTFD